MFSDLQVASSSVIVTDEKLVKKHNSVFMIYFKTFSTCVVELRISMKNMRTAELRAKDPPSILPKAKHQRIL